MFVEPVKTIDEMHTHYKNVRARLFDLSQTTQNTAMRIGPDQNKHIKAFYAEITRQKSNAIIQEKINKLRCLLIGPVDDDGYMDNVYQSINIMRQARTIVEEVCQSHGVSLNEINSSRRQPRIIAARFEAIWRVKKGTIWSLPKIGRFFGGRYHTAIIHALAAYEERTFGIVNKRRVAVANRAARAKGGAA